MSGSGQARHIVMIEVVLTNANAIGALEYVHKVLADFAEDFPWRPETTAALESLEFAAAHLGVACLDAGSDGRTK